MQYRFLFVLLIPSFLCAAAQQHDTLDTILSKIDSLEGYGPLRNRFGLEQYFAEIDGLLSKEAPSYEELLYCFTVAERLFSRRGYRDYSSRSYVYNQIHTGLTALLSKTSKGRGLLILLAKRNPLIEL